MRTFTESHVSVLDDRSAILVQHMLVSELTESGACTEHHASGLVQRSWLGTLWTTSVAVNVPVLRMTDCRCERSVIVVEYKTCSSRWSHASCMQRTSSESHSITDHSCSRTELVHHQVWV